MKTVAAINANEKVTIYYMGGLGGYHAIEARLQEVGTKPFAQYSRAAYVSYVPKGARKLRGFSQSSPNMLIVRGWNHPKPASTFAPKPDAGTDGVFTSRFTSFSPEWKSEFDASFGPLIESGKLEVVADFRHHNAR